MEPNTAVREFWDGLRNRDYRSAFARLETLFDWLSAGGSLPELQLDTTYVDAGAKVQRGTARAASE